jgi:hypothetical protein
MPDEPTAPAQPPQILDLRKVPVEVYRSELDSLVRTLERAEVEHPPAKLQGTLRDRATVPEAVYERGLRDLAHKLQREGVR